MLSPYLPAYTSVDVFFLQCYVFHLYVGVRAGGGIGDEIDSATGDPYEVYRILFDITFFFFVIIILLAIIQGKLLKIFSLLHLANFKETNILLCIAKTVVISINIDLYLKVNPHSWIVWPCDKILIWLSFCTVSGLIIDAFGELRDQLEQVKEDLEVSIAWGIEYLY